MSVPLIDGMPVAGAWSTTGIPDPPRAGTRETTFGMDGTGWVDGGSRGRVYDLPGILAGPGPTGLAVAQSVLRTLADGKAHTFTDYLGTTWPSVLVGPFRPVGRVAQDSAGNYWQHYKLTLTHLQ